MSRSAADCRREAFSYGEHVSQRQSKCWSKKCRGASLRRTIVTVTVHSRNGQCTSCLPKKFQKSSKVSLDCFIRSPPRSNYFRSTNFSSKNVEERRRESRSSETKFSPVFCRGNHRCRDGRHPRAGESEHKARGSEQNGGATSPTAPGAGAARLQVSLASRQCRFLVPVGNQTCLPNDARSRASHTAASSSLPDESDHAAGRYRADPSSGEKGASGGAAARQLVVDGSGDSHVGAVALHGEQGSSAAFKFEHAGRTVGPLRHPRVGSNNSALPVALFTLSSGLPLSPRRGRALSVLSNTSVSALVAGASPIGLAATSRCRAHLSNDSETDREKLQSLGESRSLWLVADEFPRLRVAPIATACHARGSVVPRQRQRQIVRWKHVGRLRDREPEDRENRRSVQWFHGIVLVLVFVHVVVLLVVDVAEVPVPRLRQVLLDLLRSVQAPAVPLRGCRGPGEKVLLVQVLRESVREPGRVEDAHQDAHVALQVPPLRQGVLQAVAAPRAHQDAHRREAFQLSALQPSVRRQEQPEGASSDAQRREEVLVYLVQQDVQQNVAADETSGGRVSRCRCPDRLRMLKSR